MQFSIQRPTLPSAEIHPEEKLYRRLDVTVWLRHLNENGQVEEEYKLRKVRVCLRFFFVFVNPLESSFGKISLVNCAKRGSVSNTESLSPGLVAPLSHLRRLGLTPFKVNMLMK